MTPRAWSLFETGIPSFDTLLGGGIPRRQSLIVAGDPGSGKTVLCSQLAFLAAAKGLPVVMATVTSEPHDKLVGELANFSFFKEELLGDRLFVMSAYSSLKQGARETRDLIVQTVRKRGAKLLFIDGLRAIRDLWQDEARLREFLYELGIGLAAADCIGLFTTEYPLEKLLTLPEATTVDGIVSLSVAKQGARRMRRVEVVKLRGRPHIAGTHLMRIDGEGVSFIPRMESLAPPGEDSHSPSTRASFGLPELDTLMGGGLPRTSATLLAGSMGIGKTLLAAHFAVGGARHGEPALFVSFHDSVAALAARARRIQLDVERFVADGTVTYLFIPPVEQEADLVMDRVLQEILRRGVKRLVLDGLTMLEQSITDPERRTLFLAALAERLRRLGVTTLYTREVSKVAGTELDFSDAPVSTLGENLLLLRYVELRGRIHRILSVLKMRDSAYDNDLREFQIADSGVKVLSTLRAAEGLLTGQARPLGTTIGATE
ncbi:ATPase domain-containing protein [Comamonas sp. JC664]|uniref:ATPase domain-containing protein n=1 Tax=Comamonas sp. JC664 TaxID=2801917 RepID=UPI00174AB2C5|nr:ATPase domain-containing protein [Comamonas sp. JC664]MBL0693383.1 AAA family ATPase [Comamonas sp. JC664]GHG72211.1 circadian clock protein KaiC [Comamonas sp. KCTC 72670]